MPESSAHNKTTTSVAGGASAESTPANNVGGGSGWGDVGFPKGGTDGEYREYREGRGHVDVRIAVMLDAQMRIKMVTDACFSDVTGEESTSYDGISAGFAGPEAPCGE